MNDNKNITEKELIEFARNEALKVAYHTYDVGDYLGSEAVNENTTTFSFDSKVKGYSGWSWAVILIEVDKKVTLNEVLMVATDKALLSPKWIPWAKRLRPEDMGPSDLIPYIKYDADLEKGFVKTGDSEIDEVAIDELALERERVLSPVGLDSVAQRWYAGSQGPNTTSSKISDSKCNSCGYFVKLQGKLGTTFGACANSIAYDDSKVVSYDHGCGAHSETTIKNAHYSWPDPSQHRRY